MGPAGPPGISAWGFYTEGRDLAPDEPQEWDVMCPSGKKALGGGVHTGNSSRYVTRIFDTSPAGAADGWHVGVYHNTTQTIRMYAWVICAKVAL